MNKKLWSMRYLSTLLLGCLALSSAQAAHDQREKQLTKAVQEFRSGQLDQALKTLGPLVKQRPMFRPAHLLQGDILQAKAGRRPGLTDKDGPQLRSEINVRVAHQAFKHDPNLLPDGLWRLGPNQDHVVVMDLNAARMYIYDNIEGVPRLREDFYSGGGKKGPGKQIEGDLRTPVGVYFVVEELLDKQLPDLYGAGAFPVDYPNVWDKRNKRTGSGIWLHGVPHKTWSRTPRSSRGCVTMANADFKRLRQWVDPGVTPVVIYSDIRWQPRAEIDKAQKTLMVALDQWRRDWESRDGKAYLRHYDKAFLGQGWGYQRWASHKSRVNAAKAYIKVRLTEVSMFRYPLVKDGAKGGRPMVLVSFTQDYESNNYSSKSRKRQFWRQNDKGQWLILHEDSV